jgi:hypothetical protein
VNRIAQCLRTKGPEPGLMLHCHKRMSVNFERVAVDPLLWEGYAGGLHLSCADDDDIILRRATPQLC